jgi:hypothetical protein
MNKLLVSNHDIVKKVTKFETPHFHQMKRPDLSINDVSRRTRSMISSAIDKSTFDLEDKSLEGELDKEKIHGSQKSIITINSRLSAAETRLLHKLKNRDRGKSKGKKIRLLSTNFKESLIGRAQDNQPSFEDLKNSFKNMRVTSVGRKLSENDAFDEGNKTDRAQYDQFSHQKALSQNLNTNQNQKTMKNSPGKKMGMRTAKKHH